MKFLTWSLHAPSNFLFQQWRRLASGEPWWSEHWVEVQEEIPSTWHDHQRGFVQMIVENHDKLTSIGLHDFGVNSDGTFFNMKSFLSSGDWNRQDYILNADKNDIRSPIVMSLCYLMKKYPNIEWAIQPVCMTSSTVEPILDNINGAQDTFIEELKIIARLYLEKEFAFKTIEMDFEKTNTRHDRQEWNLYGELLTRVKNEICIPLGLQLRANLFSMTGHMQPSYFGWHDYGSLERFRDMNGNRVLDQVQIMSYDFHWGGSSPGPSTPLWWLENVLKHAADVFPPSIVYPGNAGYGRRWALHERLMGVTLTYKQLMHNSNGMWVHNTNRLSDLNQFIFHDQDWIPWGSVNDAESDYLITYPHMYDRLEADHGQIGLYNGSFSMTNAQTHLTNFSRSQRPEFQHIRTVIGAPTAITGNVTLQQTVSFTEEGLNHSFHMYSVSPAGWFFDSMTQSCVLQAAPIGVNGELTYQFNTEAGSRHLAMVVGFPFFGSDNFVIHVNGARVNVGEDLEEWYPFITNPSWHFYDLGVFNLQETNTIVVETTNSAWIGGFVVCDQFISHVRGGHTSFNTSLLPFKKRGPRHTDGVSEIIDAQYPNSMTVTGEILRRPPRPAIIWEDPWGPHIRGDFTSEHDLTNFLFYQRANPQAFSINSGSNQHLDGNVVRCINRLQAIGFSRGGWRVTASDTDAPSFVWSNAREEPAQIVLNRRFRCNMRVEVDCRVLEQDVNAKIGIVIATEPGYHDSGFIFQINFENNRVEFIDRQNPVNNRWSALPDSLIGTHATRRVIALDYVNGSFGFWIGDTRYLNFDLTVTELKAYGFYAENCEARSFRMTVATLDRWEAMEELAIEIDGKIESHGRVERHVPRDRFGYIIFTGLPGHLQTAVNVAESGVANPNAQPGRAGTIFSTETIPEIWDLDYQNRPLITVPSWVNDKEIKLHMTDPGLWFKTLYVGDSQGYSVAYNSDKIGFIRTVRLIMDYGFRGISMWTLGQQDPRIFDHYIPASDDLD